MLGLFGKKKEPLEVVDLTNPTLQSMLGKYFIGQTEQLTFGGSRYAWGGLINPSDSGVTLFFDIFTVTNFTAQSFTAEIWLSPGIAVQGTNSPYVHPSNLSITPPPKPRVQLQYADQVPEAPVGGINVFDRIVAPNTTLVSDSSKGGIIIPSGGSFVLFLRSTGTFRYQARVVLSWWEEEN